MTATLDFWVGVAWGMVFTGAAVGVIILVTDVRDIIRSGKVLARDKALADMADAQARGSDD